MNAGRIFTLCLLGLLASCTLALGCIYWHIYGYEKLFGDFATFRAAALHAAQGPASAVYDVAHLRQLATTQGIKEFDSFLNPPIGLFIVYPLAFMAPVTGLIFWTATQLALLALALRTDYMRHLLRPLTQRSVPEPLVLAIIIAAFCLQSVLFGQVGVLCAALFLFTLAWRKTHPVRAGMALGLFAFKPQLGLLLPLLLLAERNWRTLICAVTTSLVLALLSLVLWGPHLWQDYANMLSIRSRFMAGDASLLFVIFTSPYAALRNLGVAAPTAIICQAALSLLLLAALWTPLRKGDESKKILILILTSYLVTPYALVYDMALLAVPCALYLRRAETGDARISELIALLLLLFMPLVAVLLQIEHIPYSVIAIGFALSVARGPTTARNG